MLSSSIDLFITKKLIERLKEEWRREELLKLSNELLKESKLTEEEALELGRKMKEGRFKKLKEQGLV